MREMQVHRKWLASSVRDLKGSLCHSETSKAVTMTSSDASVSGSTMLASPSSRLSGDMSRVSKFHAAARVPGLRERRENCAQTQLGASLSEGTPDSGV